jgi:hypothetical protein
MYEAQGTIKIINSTEKVGASGLEKREFIVTTGDSKYPQDLKFEVIKEKCTLLDQFEVGQAVNVSFNLRGNEWNGKYYVNLSCWKIQAGSGGGGGNQAAPAGNTKSSDMPDFSNGQGGGEPSMDDLRGDDIPFGYEEPPF